MRMQTFYLIIRSIISVVAIGLIIILSACNSPQQITSTSSANQKAEIKPGGIYVYKGGDGSLGTLKVLATADGTVDVLLYKNRFQTVPGSIDPKALEVNIKHEILSVRGFQEWQPQMVAEQAVTKEELAAPPQ
jgi:starvation-inducible outer membrane lipoprotein